VKYNVIKNRKHAAKFCVLTCERFFGEDNPRFPEEVKDLPGNLRRRANGAFGVLKDWVKSPNERNRARLQKAAVYLHALHEDYGVLALLLASCECAISRHWKQSMIEASDISIGMLEDKYGPASTEAIELLCQALDLTEITGCRLSDVVSREEDDVEELESFLDMEEGSE
jgi:hypothetical protein